MGQMDATVETMDDMSLNMAVQRMSMYFKDDVDKIVARFRKHCAIMTASGIGLFSGAIASMTALACGSNLMFAITGIFSLVSACIGGAADYINSVTNDKVPGTLLTRCAVKLFARSSQLKSMDDAVEKSKILFAELPDWVREVPSFRKVDMTNITSDDYGKVALLYELLDGLPSSRPSDEAIAKLDETIAPICKAIGRSLELRVDMEINEVDTKALKAVSDAMEDDSDEMVIARRRQLNDIIREQERQRQLLENSIAMAVPVH